MHVDSFSFVKEVSKLIDALYYCHYSNMNTSKHKTKQVIDPDLKRQRGL